MATTQNYNYNPASSGGIVTDDSAKIADTVKAMQKQAVDSASPVAKSSEEARLAGTMTGAQAETAKTNYFNQSPTNRAAKSEPVPTPAVITSGPIDKKNAENLTTANNLINQYSAPPNTNPSPLNPVGASPTVTAGQNNSTQNATNPQQASTSVSNVNNQNQTPVTSPEDLNLTKDQATQLFGKDFTGVQYNAHTDTFTPDQSALDRIQMTPDQISGQLNQGQTQLSAQPQTPAEQEAADLQAVQNESNAKLQKYNQDVEDLKQGRFNNPDDVAMLQQVQNTLAQNIRDQEQVNKATVASLTRLGIRQGSQGSPGQILMIGNAIENGKMKIADLENKATASMIAVKQSIQDKDMKMLNDSLSAFQANQKDRTDTIKTMYDTIHQATQDQIAQDKISRDEAYRKQQDDLIEADKIKADKEKGLDTVLNNYDQKTAQAAVNGFSPAEKRQIESDRGLPPGFLDNLPVSYKEKTDIRAQQNTDITQQKADDAAKKWQAQGGDPGTTEYWARKVISGEIQLSQLPGIGQNSIRSEVLKAIPGVASANGVNPDFSQMSVMVKGKQVAYNDLLKRSTQIEAFEGTAKKNLQNFLDIANQVDDTGSPLLNKYLRSGAKEIAGDPKLAAMDAARTTAATEIAKVLSGSMSGVLSDSARQEAEGLLKGNYTAKQLQAASDILIKDMDNRKSETDKALSDVLTKQVGVNLTPVTPPPLTKTYTSLDDLVKDNPAYLSAIGKAESDNPGISEPQILEYLNSKVQSGFNSPLSMGINGSADKVDKLASAIAQHETGNRNVPGQTGELATRYQFEPDTWRTLAGKYLGNPKAQTTDENQDKVAKSYIKDLFNQGYNERQIAMIWNGGKPTRKVGDTYTTSGKKIHYDTGRYADSVLSIYNS